MESVLSQRMRASADLITPGSVLADVGTDHGFVPIALIQEGRIKAAIAMDINEGPLDRAREHIQQAGLTEQIGVRLSDGLDGLKPREADSILIAGMGGALTERILERGGDVTLSASELILQPQSELFRVRRWLWSHGYRIMQEKMTLEEGKYYPVMRAVRTGEENRFPSEETEEVAAYYGPVLLNEHHPVLAEYLEKERKHLEGIRNQLKNADSEAAEKRAQELEHAIARNRAAREWQSSEQEG